MAVLSGRGTFLTAAFVALHCLTGFTGPLTEPQAKASLLFNLGAFVEWPAAALGPNDRITICVAGDPDVLAALRAYEGRQIEGRGVTSRPLADEEDAAGCHILFVSASRDGLALVHRLADRPVVTVGDAPEFARHGGALRVFFEQSRIRFEINTSTVARTRLRVSSRMLGLARLIRSEHEH